MNPEPYRKGSKLALHRLVLLLWVCLWTASAFSGDWRMLSGEHRDVLLNTKTGEVKGLSIARISLPTKTEPRSGFFTTGESIWCIGSSQMTDLVSGEQIELPATHLLPLNTRADAADVTCREGHLQIPFTNGFRYVDIRQGTYTDIPCKFDVEKNEGLSLRMPVLVPGTDNVFAVQGTAVMVFTAGKWNTCLTAETEPVLDVRIVTGDRWFSLIISKMKLGDLDSFSIRTVSIDRIKGNVVLDKTNPGILKQAYADGAGRPVVEYINASIIAALFQREQLKYRIIDPENGTVRERSVDVNQKRRHVYPVLDGHGDLILIVHSKDGDISSLNTRTGKIRRVAEEVPYDYRLARTGSTLQIVDSAMRPVRSVDLERTR